MVERRQHTLLVLGQIADDAVQEERRLIEQALGRLRALQHDALRHRAQARFLVVGEIASGEDDDRDVAQPRFPLHFGEKIEARHVGQP